MVKGLEIGGEKAAFLLAGGEGEDLDLHDAVDGCPIGGDGLGDD
jgi:hypothetical protein